MIHYKETPFGFEYGAANVERCCSDNKKGWVVIRVRSPKKEIDIYITKTGKIRIHGGKGEFFEEGRK